MCSCTSCSGIILSSSDWASGLRRLSLHMPAIPMCQQDVVLGINSDPCRSQCLLYTYAWIAGPVDVLPLLGVPMPWSGSDCFGYPSISLQPSARATPAMSARNTVRSTAFSVSVDCMQSAKDVWGFNTWSTRLRTIINEDVCQEKWSHQPRLTLSTWWSSPRPSLWWRCRTIQWWWSRWILDIAAIYRTLAGHLQMCIIDKVVGDYRSKGKQKMPPGGTCAQAFTIFIVSFRQKQELPRYSTRAANVNFAYT